MNEKQYDFPTEVLDLPSEGKVYPKDNPLSSGRITIKLMTAKEEDILSNSAYIENGTVLDKLLESVIVDTAININDLVIGDKNAILVTSRILAFGPEYAAKITDPFDREEVDIRTYSIIYDAINDLKDAMEGMLAPEMKEEVLGTAEIREIFKISKVGSIAGSMVMDGKIVKNSKIRIIRDGVVVHDGELLALKRFKDDVKDVAKGYDCGIQIKGYNDIEERDIIESYHEVAIKKKLK